MSYRRDDTDIAAGRLYDNLKDRFDVFMDIDTIGPGEDYAKVLDDAVGSCDVLLALIGKQWLAVEDAAGRRRLENEHDWVRQEIEAALDRGLRVIPLLLQEASMPSVEELPASLSGLARRQAHRVSNERWSYDVGRLVEALDKVREAKEAQVPHEKRRAPDERGAPKERQGRGLLPILRSRTAVVAGAVLGGAVVLGAALWLLRGDDSAFGWTDISASLPMGPRGEVNAVITFPERRGDPYVAGGRSGDDAALWTSDDGHDWQRVALESGGESAVTFLMPRAPGALAVGQQGSGENAKVAIWHTDDFNTWTREDVDLPGNATSALQTNRGLFVTGSEGGNAAVWRRGETGSLERIDDVDFKGETEAAITRILCLPAPRDCRSLVAAGWSTWDGSEDAVVWTSDDGGSDSWALHRIRDTTGDQRINHVTRFGPRLVAVGYHEAADGSGTRLAVWLSSDGRDWDPVPGLEADVSQRAEVVVSRGAADDGLPELIAGGSRGERGDRDAAVWTSDDGETWRLEPDDVFGGEGDQEIVALAGRRLPVIAVGERGGGIGVWCGGDC